MRIVAFPAVAAMALVSLACSQQATEDTAMATSEDVGSEVEDWHLDDEAGRGTETSPVLSEREAGRRPASIDDLGLRPSGAADAVSGKPAPLGDGSGNPPPAGPVPAQGYALLSSKSEMQVGRTYAVKLQVGEERRLDDMRETAQSMGDATETGALEMAPFVCGELTANGFKVDQPLRQCQNRGRSPQVSFDWEVSPETERPLTLQAKAITYDSPGGDPIDQRDSETLEITVNADGWTKLKAWLANATDAMGGLRVFLIGLLGVLAVLSAIVWRLKRLGKKPEGGLAEPAYDEPPRGPSGDAPQG